MDDEQENNNGAVLDIFEHNEFRHLLHLQLNLKSANDEEARRHLSKKLLIQKKVNNELAEEKELLLER